ncbi:zinc-dependent peptidase [Primorskyibacter aestuariivivens]|uniref:M90 family metallopeptidase n=1 Tax=Primorskyibacter aestuariivivens TaxID=1888912 RepID=UPI0023006026|nr:M90 family metallopeptidase [Primorskyibacter aestuariivivens]MDA7427491.1 zinc-dependent peptidase [Primorskyibacter aestuariivivens]
MPYLFLILVVAGVAFFVLRRMQRKQVIAELLATPLDDAQRRVIAEQVPITQRLPPELRAGLEGRIHRFLEQVDFHGCNGLEVDDGMRLSIAAQACLLVVNSDAWYDGLSTILVYPGAFKSVQQNHDGYVVTEEEVVRTGESWLHGPVVLSWSHSERGARDDRDGHNVVIHEFAHQFDALSGATNGVPLLGPGQSFAEWERTFLEAFEAHVRRVETGRKTVIDAYGATGHEEFFAVAVELFFERPAALRREAPEVYAQLARLFRLDPATWG